MRGRTTFHWFVRLYLVAALGVAATLVTSGDGQGSSLSFLAIWSLLYLGTCTYLATGRGALLRRSEFLVYSLGALVLISASWSAEPRSTLSYGASLVAGLLFACACNRRLTVEQFIGHLRWSINWVTSAGLVLGLLGVGLAYHIDPLTRANVLGTSLIKGIYAHKIYAGFYCSIGFYLNVVCGGRRSWLWALLCLIGVLGSGSSLGIASLAIGAMAWLIVKLLSRRESRLPRFTVMIIGVLCVLGLVSAMLTTALELLGRDATLTGRTMLWAWAIEFWSQRPILGWGYSGIFGDGATAPGSIIGQYSYYQAPHFHSAYLQALAELGLLGFVLVLALVMTATIRCIRSYWSTTSSLALAAAIICVVVSTSAFGMHLLIRHNEISSVLVAYFMLAYHRECSRQTASAMVRIR